MKSKGDRQSLQRQITPTPGSALSVPLSPDAPCFVPPPKPVGELELGGRARADSGEVVQGLKQALQQESESHSGQRLSYLDGSTQRKVAWVLDKKTVLTEGSQDEVISPTFRFNTSQDPQAKVDPERPDLAQLSPPMQLKLLRKGADGSASGSVSVMVQCPQGARMKYSLFLNGHGSGTKVLMGTKFWVDFPRQVAGTGWP